MFKRLKTVDVAQTLIGQVIIVQNSRGPVSGLITETEAYTQEDPACHTYRGRKTKRNEAMFKAAGHLYIYFIYGMYHCLNIVTEAEGRGCAVLIRSIEPIEGQSIMQANRGQNCPKAQWCNGPAKLVMALGVQSDWNGLKLGDPNTPVQIQDQGYRPQGIHSSTRVGISKGQGLPWRFSCQEFKHHE